MISLPSFHILTARPVLPILTAFALSALPALAASSTASWKFDFGTANAAPGYTAVTPADAYSAERGFGFEAGGGKPVATDRGGKDPLTGDFITSDQPFFFSVNVPEGNYRVRVTLGDSAGESATTIKAELRRLMVEHATTKTGKFESVEFIVNTRSPKIAAVGDIKEGTVNLKAPRESEQEAWAWDDKITLEFNDSHPAVCAIEITRVEVPTIYVLGDSTVCDQSREPFASWGQMLPRFFQPVVAISNHGESGETYSSSLSRRRIDKIVSTLKPGEVVLMQFGHNDQKEKGEGKGPFLHYKDNIKKHVAMIRARGGVPVIVSPMERRSFDDAGKVKHSLADFAEGARQAAKEIDAPFIDLNAISVPYYEFLEAKGKEVSRKAFAGQDNTHHNNYGSYELAKAIAQGLRDAKVEVAKYLRPDFTGFDPHHPDPVETFALPATPGRQGPRPLGD